MRRLLTRLRRLFCRHDWRLTRFQAFVPGWSVECRKCGRTGRKHHDGSVTLDRNSHSCVS